MLVPQNMSKLFLDRNLVFVATLMKDGSPQLSPVWADLDDDHIMINTAEGRIKHKNVLRDPRVAVSVVSHTNPLDMVTIRGRVVKIIPDYDYKHADQLAQKYMQRQTYPYKRQGEKRIILKIVPEKIFVMPPLTMNDK